MTPPDPESVFAELRNLLFRICDQTPFDVTAATLLNDIPGMDSLRLLQTVAHLEEFFHVEIDTEVLATLDRARDVVNAITGARPMDDQPRLS